MNVKCYEVEDNNCKRLMTKVDERILYCTQYQCKMLQVEQKLLQKTRKSKYYVLISKINFQSDGK